MDKVILVSKISSLGKGGKILFILSLVCVLVLPANSEITATDPTIYWSMDSLFGYQQGDPTVVTNCISGSCNNCISGSCIKFDGSSGILVGTSGTTNSPIQNKATYSLWIKTGSDVTSQQYILTQDMVDNVYGRTRVGRGVFIQNNIMWVFSRKTITPDGANSWEQIELGEIFPDSWYYIALVQNGSSLIGYVDGKATQPMITFNGYISTYSDYWGIGCLSQGGIFFSGQLDEINIFSSALSASSIESLYQSDNNPTIKMGLLSPVPSTTTVNSQIGTSFLNKRTNSQTSIFLFDIVLLVIIIGVPSYILISKGKVNKKISTNENIPLHSRANNGTNVHSDQFNIQRVHLCQNCGSKLDLNDNFCQNCGSPIIVLK